MAITNEVRSVLEREAPAAVLLSGTLNAVNDTLGEGFDASAFQAVAVQLTGTFVGTVTFQVSNDGVTWAARQLVSSAGVLSSTSTNQNLFSGDIGARYFRAVITAYTSGTINLSMLYMPESQANVQVTQTVSIPAGTAGPQKDEDSAHANGHAGLFVMGVRAPAPPASPTSAAGDYSYIMVDREGKIVTSGNAGPEYSWQAYIALTTTSDVALRASAGAGLRNFVTDLVIENTGASAIRVFLKDGATTIASVTVPAGNTIDVSFRNPILGTAATALNLALSAAGTVFVTGSGYIGV